jgi:hypothetical protein
MLKLVVHKVSIRLLRGQHSSYISVAKFTVIDYINKICHLLAACWNFFSYLQFFILMVLQSGENPYCPYG